ncbi:MAG: PAS domain S-box protein [Rhodospirillales bacterium]
MAAAPGLSILVIEPDPNLQVRLSDSLTAQGFAPVSAADGETALLLFADQSFDLVITEQRLPGMTGLDVIRRLSEADPLFPLLMITGDGGEQLVIDVLSLGNTGYAIKDDAEQYLDDLADTIAMLLDRSAARRKRQRAESALAESEERYRRLVQASPICIHEIDLDGRLASMNPAGLRMMGVENENEVCGLRYLDVPVAEDRERIATLLEQAKRGTSSEFEFRVETPDRLLYFASSFQPVRNAAGDIVKLMGVTQDITDQREADLRRLKSIEELRESQEELRRINELNRQASDIAHLGHWLWDNTNGACVYFSDSLPKLRGVTSDGYRANAADIVLHRGSVHADDRAAVDKVDREAGERPYTIEYRAYLPDGTMRWYRETGEPYDIGGSDISYSIGTTQDITEAKEAEQKLQEALVSLEKADRAKSNFLATLSHEMRTPLNAILGFSQIMMDENLESIGSDKRLQYARDIHTSGAHMLALINDVLDLSAIEYGQRKFDLEPVDLKEVLTECINQTTLAGASDKLTIALDIPDDIPPVWAEKRSVFQIALNLLSNAAKYSPDDGKIVVSATSDGDSTTVLIADNGIGIAKNELETVTEPFAQSNRNPTLAKEGAGLGLSIVKALVEGHGGQLKLDSELGVGTKISFSLPNRPA